MWFRAFWLGTGQAQGKIYHPARCGKGNRHSGRSPGARVRSPAARSALAAFAADPLKPCPSRGNRAGLILHPIDRQPPARYCRSHWDVSEGVTNPKMSNQYSSQWFFDIQHFGRARQFRASTAATTSGLSRSTSRTRRISVGRRAGCAARTPRPSTPPTTRGGFSSL